MTFGRSRKPKTLRQMIQRHRSPILLGSISLFLACIFSYFWSHNTYFPIKNVKIYGAQHINHADVTSAIFSLVKGSFFNTNVGLVKERIELLPWVDHVAVKRVWPDRIVIMITEKKAVAQWNDIGLLSDVGKIFVPQQGYDASSLPKFIGPIGEQLLMTRYYARINRILNELHFSVKQFELAPDFSFHLQLENGIKVNIGHKDILTRLSHFVRVYPKIVGNRDSEVEYIDLRYPNGVAVKWKS